MSAKKIAACGLATALLLAVQFALSNVQGVELVTVLLLSFCYAFGAFYGVLTATAFSLLRCLIFGFNPVVVVLYLIYYNLFAIIFGFVGKKRLPVWVCPVLLAVLAVLSGYLAGTGLPVSILYQKRLSVMLWVLFGITTGLLLFYFIVLLLKRGDTGREIASVTALAAFMTVLFTLLDDVLEPLFYGWSMGAAVGYFYTSFLAMLPQMICSALTVFLLFYPLKRIFFAAAGRKESD